MKYILVISNTLDNLCNKDSLSIPNQLESLAISQATRYTKKDVYY